MSVVTRYGSNLTFGLAGKHRWKLLVPCALLMVLSSFFSSRIFYLTTNGGELFILLGATALLNLVQDELGLASSFADFLHRSNLAFKRSHVELELEEAQAQARFEEAAATLKRSLNRVGDVTPNKQQQRQQPGVAGGGGSSGVGGGSSSAIELQQQQKNEKDLEHGADIQDVTIDIQ